MATKPELMESKRGHYLAVFTSNKTSPKWQTWNAKTDAERAATDEVGLAALKKWDEDHAANIVYGGGPLGPTKRWSESGITDVVNELTAFVVVRAPSHEAAAKLFENHPHITIFPCDAVEVMPLLGGRVGVRALKLVERNSKARSATNLHSGRL